METWRIGMNSMKRDGFKWKEKRFGLNLLPKALIQLIELIGSRIKNPMPNERRKKRDWIEMNWFCFEWNGKDLWLEEKNDIEGKNWYYIWPDQRFDLIRSWSITVDRSLIDRTVNLERKEEEKWWVDERMKMKKEVNFKTEHSWQADVMILYCIDTIRDSIQ